MSFKQERRPPPSIPTRGGSATDTNGSRQPWQMAAGGGEVRRSKASRGARGNRPSKTAHCPLLAATLRGGFLEGKTAVSRLLSAAGVDSTGQGKGKRNNVPFTQWF